VSSARAVVNLMYLHARTYHAVKELDQSDADGDGVSAAVGFENLAVEFEPHDAASDADVQAAARFDYMVNQQFINGVTLGDVDVDMDGKADNPSTDPPEGHVPELAGTLDYIGLNYYQRVQVEAGGPLGGLAPFNGTPLYDTRNLDVAVPHSDMYQEISSRGLRTVIEEYSRYKLPLYVTETGLADADDDQRPYYLVDHLFTVAKAIRDGYDVRGLYVWTISDNFEWAQGTGARFGMYSVDFGAPGFPRTKLRSADCYSAIAHARGIDAATWNAFALAEYPVGIP
jgi:beta-glucosidase/6-phospho-beta-glucosidase/beta-galactosidase